MKRVYIYYKVVPFRDAIKLFRKEIFIILKSNYITFYICNPILFFFRM